MSNKKQSFSGPAGEHFVLAELLKQGKEAYLAHGETQKGWDIVRLRSRKAPIRIQVKTIDWPTEITVNGKFQSGFDILVVVLLNKPNSPRYLIIPRSKLIPFLSKLNPKRGAVQSLTIGKSFEDHATKDLKQFEDKWNSIR